MTERTAPDWLTKYSFAHRGLHSGSKGLGRRDAVPENTRAAIRAAIDRGLGIECDIQLSSDGKPLVFHDFDLQRLTGAIGKVADRNADELCTLQIAGTEQKIWTLADMLDEVAAQVPILIEVKSQASFSHEDISRVSAACLKDMYDYRGVISVMSFDSRVPEWFSRHASDVVRGFVGTDTHRNGFEGLWHNPAAMERAQPDFLAADLRDIEAPTASNWRARGKPLLTWTVRTAADRFKAEAYADALIAEGDGVP